MEDVIEQEKRPPSTTAVAVAVVALARFLAATNPALGAFLAGTLDSAAKAGLSPTDLELLKTLVESFS